MTCDPRSLGTVAPDDFRRIRDVFESALERRPDERRAFVEEACGGNTLLVAEVERMLAAEDTRHSLLDAPAHAAASRGVVECASCRAHMEPGHRFCPACGTPTHGSATDEGRFRSGALFANRFRIVARLGHGGMGDDLEVGQPVALKFLTGPGPAETGHYRRFDDRARARLRLEVRLARQISHSNVCRVYDIGQSQGELYLSMEYVDGEDLAALLTRIGRLPIDKGIEIARRLCAGLAAAHAKGVLHRDFKPANIMIDSHGEVRIMDFGLAAIASELDANDLRSGTPAYMAPEQLAGKEATKQSDLYALGLVLFELFTGKPAFDAKTLDESLRMRESGPATTPSTLIPELSARLERAILKCLEPDPQQRPGTALEVSASLPGGDPLAEALAAGETPSPEMVAASGPTSGLRPAVALAMVVAVAITLTGALMVTARTRLAGGLTREYSPDVLAQRAREVTRAFGHRVPENSAYGFINERTGIGPEAFVSFWFRQSDEAVTPQRPPVSGFWPGLIGIGRVSSIDPAPDSPGIVSVDLDGAGRLLRFVAPQVPPLAIGCFVTEAAGLVDCLRGSWPRPVALRGCRPAAACARTGR